MGFMDKLKKAAEHATEAVGRATEAAKPFVSGVVGGLTENMKSPHIDKPPEPKPIDLEAARAAREAWKAEQAAKKKQQLEDFREEVRKYAETPSNCDKGMGDCVTGCENFCYTCPVNCECRRKQMVPSNLQYPILNPDYLPYAKWEEAALKKIYQDIPAGDRTREVIRDWCRSHTDPFYEIWDAFIKLVLPDYDGFGFAKRLSESMSGFGTKNRLLTFLVRAYDNKLDLETFRNIPGTFSLSFDFLDEIDHNIEIKKFDKVDFHFTLYRHIDLDFYYNPSLYRRSADDYYYVETVFEFLSSPEVFGYFFPNLEFDPEKWTKMLIDENGDIKPAGRGGPAQGEWGDTVCNAIEEIQRLNYERG